MKFKAFVLMVFMMGVAAACSTDLVAKPAASTPFVESPMQTDIPTEKAGAVPEGTSVSAKIQLQLAKQLQLQPEEIKILESTAVEWPDSCLGISSPGQMCAQVVTAGYRLVLEANGQRYIYHTDALGNRAILETALASGQAVSVILLEITQGAGQRIQVNNQGVVVDRQAGQPLSAPFAAPRRGEELRHFLDTFQPFSVDLQLGKLTFKGTGLRKAALVEQRSIAEWVYLVGTEVSGGGNDPNLGLALSWKRDGGIVGFCDRLSISRSGVADIQNCKSGKKSPSRYYLEAGQLEKLYAWLDRYTPSRVVSGDSAAADSMMLSFDLLGTGKETLTANLQNEIFLFCTGIYNSVAK
jgi:hypothetical protein